MRLTIILTLASMAPWCRIPLPPEPPAPTPAPDGCMLPPMPECGGVPYDPGPPRRWGCCVESEASLYAAAVDEAQDYVVSSEGWRRWPGLVGVGNRVRNEDDYVRAVATRLIEMGYCAAQGEPSDEVAVKRRNDYSEQFDIVMADMTVRRHGHTVYCVPARFDD